MHFQKTILFSIMTLTTLTVFNSAQAMFANGVCDAEQEPMSPRTQGYHDGVDIYLSQFDKNGSTNRRFLRDTNRALGTQAVREPADLRTSDAAFTRFKQAIADAVHQLDRVAVRDFIREANEHISKLQAQDATGKAQSVQSISRVRIARLAPTAASYAGSASTSFAPQYASASQTLPGTRGTSSAAWATSQPTTSQSFASTSTMVQTLAGASTSSSRRPVFDLTTRVSYEEWKAKVLEVFPTEEEQATMQAIEELRAPINRLEHTAQRLEILGTQHATAARTAADSAVHAFSEKVLAFLATRTPAQVFPTAELILKRLRYTDPFLHWGSPAVQMLYPQLRTFLKNKELDETPGSPEHMLFSNGVAVFDAHIAHMKEPPSRNRKDAIDFDFDAAADRPLPRDRKDAIDFHFHPAEAEPLHRSVEKALRAHSEKREDEAASHWMDFTRKLTDYLLQRTPEQAADIYWDFRNLVWELFPTPPAAYAPIMDHLAQTLETLRDRASKRYVRERFIDCLHRLNGFRPGR